MEWIVCIVILGLLFDYTNGFHDAANVVSTVIATRALAPIAAIVMAGVLNTIGALQSSGVAQTIASGLVKETAATQPLVIAALIGAIAWNFGTWYFGMPSSSSYALIGGLIGASLVEGGLDVIIWGGLAKKVLIPMVLSPFIGFGIAYGLMKAVYRWGKTGKSSDRMFRYFQVASGGLVALAHGVNDAQKSMGIITLGLFSAGAVASTAIPLWVILACAVTMGIGTASGGFRIIRVVGFRITKLTPPQGFAAEVSASFVILLASFFGMPISSSQMIAGSVGGSGAAKHPKAVEWRLGKAMAITWLITLPGSAVISALSFYLIHFFL